MPKMSNLFLTLCLQCILLLVISCGSDSNSSSDSSSAVQREESVQSQAFMKSQILPLNINYSGQSVGQLYLRKSQSHNIIQIVMSNTNGNINHVQAIYSADSCPKDLHDINNDGVIDLFELEKHLGSKKVFLEKSVTSGHSGDFSLSRSSDFGNYEYWLQLNSSNIKNTFQNSRSVVVIFGVDSFQQLPLTLNSLNNDHHKFFPIACGVIVRN